MEKLFNPRILVFLYKDTVDEKNNPRRGTRYILWKEEGDSRKAIYYFT